MNDKGVCRAALASPGLLNIPRMKGDETFLVGQHYINVDIYMQIL